MQWRVSAGEFECIDERRRRYGRGEILGGKEKFGRKEWKKTKKQTEGIQLRRRKG